MSKLFYVYLLASAPCGHLYVGVTGDLVQRISDHKSGLFAGHTGEHGIDCLVWYEIHKYIDQAILREKRIKRWRRDWKFALVEAQNPHWLDLYGEVCVNGPSGPVRRTADRTE